MSEADWSKKATWMRSVGATSASFAHDGTLLEVTLGPEVPDPDGATKHEDPDGDARAMRRSPTPGLVPRVPRHP